MTWVRIDDQSAFNEKVVLAGNAAWGGFVRMLAWSNAQLSDGVVPMAIAKAICRRRDLAKLAEVGLVVLPESGQNSAKQELFLAKFLTYQPSRAEVLESRDKDAKRKRKSRENNPLAEMSQGDSGADGGRDSGCESRDPTPPHPTPTKETPCSPPTASPLTAELEEVWQHFVATRAANMSGRAPLLTKKRRGHIRARIRETDVATCKRAIDGMFADPWHRANPETLKPENVFRSVEKFEDKLAKAERHIAPPPPPPAPVPDDVLPADPERVRRLVAGFGGNQ